MHRRKLIALSAVAVIAIAAWVAIKNTRSVTPVQGTICGEYNLPDGAQAHQVGIGKDANGNAIIILDYQSTSGPGILTMPFDTIAVTCNHPLIRGVVAGAQEGDRQATQWSCKFVEDLMAGRVQLSPSMRDSYDRAYAEQWYRKTCLGPK